MRLRDEAESLRESLGLGDRGNSGPAATTGGRRETRGAGPSAIPGEVLGTQRDARGEGWLQL